MIGLSECRFLESVICTVYIHEILNLCVTELGKFGFELNWQKCSQLNLNLISIESELGKFGFEFNLNYDRKNAIVG